MGEKPMRRYPRLPLRQSVLVTVCEGAPVDHLGRTESVGLGGCGFVSQISLGVGSTIELMISARPIAIRTRARVVYEIPRDGGGFEVGVEFEALEPEDRAILEGLVGESLSRRASS